MPSDAPVYATDLAYTTDPLSWANAFDGWFGVSPNPDIGTLADWFDAAIHAGRNQGRRELCPHRRISRPSPTVHTCLDCGETRHATPTS